MEPLHKLTKSFKRKKNITEDDISLLVSLPEDKLLKITESLNTLQKQKIYQSLCTTRTPDWIQQTVKIHNTHNNLKSSLPTIKEKQNYKKIVKMIMISAGDFNPPLKVSVDNLYKYIKDYLQENSNLSKRLLEEKFSDIKEKYNKNNKKVAPFEEIEGEEQEEQEEQFEDTANNKNEDMRNVERLQFNDERTKNMTEDEYFYFTECRKASFLKYGKEKFVKWLNIKHSPKLFSWIGRERIFSIIENANRNRNEELKLAILSSPITIDELKID